jgi:glycosyltransferase involved in cell wall biosynthesis
VYRLGVPVHTDITPASGDGVLRIVSCSWLIPRKRVHLIIQSLQAYLETAQVRVEWVHIGDGYLKKKLEKYAAKAFSKKNIIYAFKGYMENEEIFEYYRTHSVDLFMHVSSSEGVPVSIMEALSFGIPVLASNSGGVAEIVDEHNGHLVDLSAGPEDIAECIGTLSLFRDPETRKRIKTILYETYSAEKNYPEFIRTALLNKDVVT